MASAAKNRRIVIYSERNYQQWQQRLQNERKISQICRTMGVIKDRNVFLGNIRKANALPMKYAKIGLANKGNSGFHFLLS